MTDWFHALTSDPFRVRVTGAVIVVLLAAVLRIAQRVVVRRLDRLARRTTTEADDLIVELLRRISLAFIVAGCAVIVGGWLPVSEGVHHLLRAVFVVACVYQLGVWGNGVITVLIDRRAAASGGAAATTLAALGFLGRLALWSALVLLALENLGVNVTALVAGLGIGGVALALAVQNVLGDLLASVAILLDRPFELGDFIIIDEVMGSVEHIGLKTTRIRSLSGEQIVVANAQLLSSRIRNYKRMSERRVVFSLGITYETPHALVARVPGLIREAVEQQEGVRFDRAHFQKYGDFALIFEVVFYVLSPDYNRYMDVQQAINLDILEQFEREGIEFAYPTQTLKIPEL
ncbi:MAG: mechanosensitive ion channel family protein, partial [Deltaproteobacteria bacterium]